MIMIYNDNDDAIYDDVYNNFDNNSDNMTIL